MTIVFGIYFALVVVMSAVCYIAYGFDKWRAVNDDRRVPERMLHLLAFLGGWPGALLGQRQFRHKTKKLSFLVAFWLVVILNLTIVGVAMYVFSKPSQLPQACAPIRNLRPTSTSCDPACPTSCRPSIPLFWRQPCNLAR
jgi:uncharacterized membrane protein YsdA (DUF1294 family)